MDLSEIISAIQNSGIENSEKLTKAITDYTKSLQKTHEKESSNLINKIEALTTAVGIDRGTTEERIAAANNAISKLTEENSVLKTDKESLSASLAKTQKDIAVKDAASISKANATVLSTLIGDEELTVEGEKVLVAGKELKAWAQDKHSPFMSALFPTEQQQQAQSNYSDAPAHFETKSQVASSKSETESEKSVADKHVERFYKKPEFAI